MTTRHAGRAGRAAIVLCAAVATPAAAMAQRPARQDSLAPVPLAPLEISVLRMPLATVRVPYAVASVDAHREGRAQPGLGLDEALRAVPGVQVDNRYNYALGERIAIRGFGARAQFGVRGVKVLLDGIPATLADGQTTLNHIDPGTLGRVEVIRGPAASLYGNAAGGVIQLETVAPPPTPIQEDFRFLAGSDGLNRVQSRTGGRSGGFEYQANVSRLAYDGYRQFSDARNIHADAQLGYASGADRLRLSANFVDYDAKNPGSLSDSLLHADRSQAYANNIRQHTGEAGRQGQLGLSWRHGNQERELEVAAYGVLRTLDNPIPNRIIDLDRRAGGVRILYRGRIGSGGRDVLWSIGGDVDAQHDDRRNTVNLEGERGDLTLDQIETVRALGAFGQISIPLTASLNVLASLRYDRIRFAADDRLVNGNDPDDSGHRTMDALDPSAGITWSPSDALDLYANFATSFQTPTTTELANRPDGAGGFNPSLRPEHTRSVEVGARGSLAPGVNYQLAVYRAVVDDELIGFEVPAAPGRTFFRNAGSALHRGIEAALSVSALPGLRARASYTFTDARFRDYEVDGVVYDGNRLPGVAPHRFEAVLSFEPAPWYAELDGRYVSRIRVNDANTAASSGYAVFDLRAGLTPREVGGVSIAPFAGIDNVLDREYNTSVVINAFGGRYFEPGPGRAFYAGASVVVGAYR